MTQKEWDTYCDDVYEAEKRHKNSSDTPYNLAWNFREISKRKWNAEMFDIPYVSVFEGVE